MKRIIGLRILILCLLVFSAEGCAPAMDCSNLQASKSCTRVLFIGNSYTYVNDLPNTFVSLARAGGHRTEVGMSAQGGWMLADHVKSSDTIAKINSGKWNFVVLQEQSEVPAFQQSRNQEMYPAASILVGDIRQVGAVPIFLITWAYRDGLPANRMPNYESMQAQIDNGYLITAEALGTRSHRWDTHGRLSETKIHRSVCGRLTAVTPPKKEPIWRHVSFMPIFSVKARRGHLIKAIYHRQPRTPCKKPRRILSSTVNGESHK